MKKLLVVAAFAAVIAFAHSVSAQVTTLTGATTSAAEAATVFMPGAVGGTFVQPGSGGGAGRGRGGGGHDNGLFNQPQLIMSTASAPSISTFNECNVGWSAGVWFLSASNTYESPACSALREGLARQKIAPGSAEYERMCIGSDGWRKMDERTAQSCYDTKVAIAKSQPRVQPVSVVPTPVAARVYTVCDPQCREVPYPAGYASN